MYTLTERRLVKIKPILEKHRERFVDAGSLDAKGLEHELRQCLDTGYREIKEVILSLSKMPRYGKVAAYYMQHNEAPMPTSQFQKRLAELYGMKQYDHADAAGKRKKFWDRAIKKSDTATKPTKK